MGKHFSALSTDLYQLTMISSLIDANKQDERAVFELFIRKFPGNWNRVLLCGIEEAINEVINLRFDDEELKFLENVPNISKKTIQFLSHYKFSGEIRAFDEGTFVLENEPFLQVSASLCEAQLIETLLLSIINYQSLVATKAYNIVKSSFYRPVYDFGLRRGPLPEASLRAARSGYIAGFAGTSNVKAGFEYNIPIVGTHAHSFVMSFSNELDAFEHWCKDKNETSILIDTYDVMKAAESICKLSREKKVSIKYVRIDSGNLVENALKVREILDKNGLIGTKIMLSGDLNENKITNILEYASNAVDAFGVGTDFITARPESALGGVYKLVELGDIPKKKNSENKASYKWKKDVYRCETHDTIVKFGEKAKGESLLKVYVNFGERIKEERKIEVIRKSVASTLEEHTSNRTIFGENLK